MSLKTWVSDRFHNPEKEAELDAREARTDAHVEALREERLRNGFGTLFEVATRPAPRPHHRPRRP